MILIDAVARMIRRCLAAAIPTTKIHLLRASGISQYTKPRQYEGMDVPECWFQATTAVSPLAV
jgi:tRNA G37 N-methylase TrmD